MSIHVQVLREGGFPVSWSTWGDAHVDPGKSTVIGSGMGPFFTVIGVQDGAIFQRGNNLNITLKVHGVAQQAFTLYDGINAGQYIALVSNTK